MASIIYVDAINGSDKNTGASAGAAVKSLAAAATLIQNGSQIFLRGGQTWNEQLNIFSPNVTLSSYGDGGNATVNGGGQRHGVVVQAANATISNINTTNCWNGIYAAGDTASVTVNGGVYDGNGTGIVAGFGAVLTKVDGARVLNSTLALGAGDGIQVCEDAGLGPHTFTNIYASGNAKQGLNFKIGTAHVSNSTFERNGETGVLGQVHASLMVLENNVLRENNTANNGTFNLGLENNVEIRSSYNVFANPTQGSLISNNVNMTGASRFVSNFDQYIENASMTNMGASIRTHTLSNSAGLQVSNALFDVQRTGGFVIDTWGASNLTLNVSASTFSTGTLPVYRTASGQLPSVPSTWFSDAPQISIADMANGSLEDSGSFTFQVTRSGSATGTSTVDYNVSGSGASAADANDFLGGIYASGSVTFNAGETVKTITIRVNSDQLKELNETFQVNLTNVVGATVGKSSALGTIMNDDADPVLSIQTAALFTLPTSAAPTSFFSATSGKTLSGSGGADQLTGTDVKMKGGRLVGGAGDDTYVIRNVKDVITENSGAGVDTVVSHVGSLTLGANIENLVLKGSAAQVGYGNSGDNLLVSNNHGSMLHGGDGKDILVAGKGGDTLSGGSGTDIFRIESVPYVAARITDFTAGSDVLDLRAVIKGTGYTGTDAFADGIVKLESNGAGGTNVLVDTNGGAFGGDTLVAKLDNVAPTSLVPSRDIAS